MPSMGKLPDFKFGKTLDSYADKSRQKGMNLLIFAPDKYSTREKTYQKGRSFKSLT